MPCMVFPFTSNKTLNAYYSLVKGKGIGIHLIEPELKKFAPQCTQNVSVMI